MLEEPEPKAPVPADTNPTSGDEVLSAVPDYVFLSNFLGIEGKAVQDNMAKILEIWSWGKEKAGKADKVEIATQVKKLIDQNGWRVQGKVLTNELYQWIRLDADRQRIQKQQDLLNYVQPS